MVKNFWFWRCVYSFWQNPRTWRTDGQTDRQTDTIFTNQHFHKSKFWFWRCVYSFWQNPRTWRTDGQTDRQTDTNQHDGIGRVCIASRVKKSLFSTNVSLYRVLSTMRPSGVINRVSPDRASSWHIACVQHLSEAHLTVLLWPCPCSSTTKCHVNLFVYNNNNNNNLLPRYAMR